MVISAAAASFGGTAGLAWLAPWAAGMRVQTTGPDVEMSRNWGWITFGAASGVILIFVLGPGVRFRT